MTAHVLRDVLVKGLLSVDHATVLSVRMEHGEVNNKGIALASNQVLSDHLVGARVCNFAKVNA